MSTKPTPEKAFKRANAGYELFGKRLFPFSAMRQGVAASMGMRFGLVDREDIFTITSDDVKGKKKGPEMQFYNQLFSDVVKALWLCSVPDSRVLRAERRIDEAKIDAFEWADANGMGLTTEKYYAASAVFFTVMVDKSSATGEPVVPENGKDEGEDDPNE